MFLANASDTKSSGRRPVVPLDEALHVLKAKPHHAFRSLAIAGAWNPDAANTPLGRHLVNKGQAAFQNPFHVLRG
jgi:hypothetical protein